MENSQNVKPVGKQTLIMLACLFGVGIPFGYVAEDVWNAWIAFINVDGTTMKPAFLIQWISLVAMACLLKLAGVASNSWKDSSNKATVFISLAAAILVFMMIPAIVAAWSIFGDFPMKECPGCSTLDKIGIMSTGFFTLSLVFAPFALIAYLFTLKK